MSAEGRNIGAGQLLTHDEAAAYLRVCPKTLRSLRQRGLIRYVAVTARKIFYRPEDCDAYLASCVRMDEQRPEPRVRGRSIGKRRSGNIVPFSARQENRR